MQKNSIILTSAVLLVCISTVQAAPAYWTDWTSSSFDPDEVLGSLTVGLTTVDVTYSGPYFFAQTAGGTNYWTTPSTYTSAEVDNAPPASDIIALSTGGTKTITFSEPIQDPLIALVSWNSNTVDFGVPIEILSYGPGFWGNGTPILNTEEDGFFGNGEVHGVIRLPGSHSSITFTDTTEPWHGFTVGVLGLAETQPPQPAPSGIPAPGALLLAGLGTGLMGYMRRRGVV